MEGKKTPAQVAQCQDHLGHKYRGGMQQPNAGSTRARSALRLCPLCKVHVVAASRSYTLCNLCWWCFSLYQLAQILYLHSWWSSCTATFTGGVFLGALAHLLMCSQTNMHKLQIALCGGGDCGMAVHAWR